MFAVLGIVVAVLGLLGLVGLRIAHVAIAAGVESSGQRPTGDCALIAEETLTKLHTSDYTRVSVSDGPDGPTANCLYTTLKGTNGGGHRSIQLDVYRFERADGAAENERRAQRFYRQRLQAMGAWEKPADGPALGDETEHRLQDDGASMRATALVRKSTVVIQVGFFGYDKGFFGDTAASADEARGAVSLVATELLGRIAGG